MPLIGSFIKHDKSRFHAVINDGIINSWKTKNSGEVMPRYRANSAAFAFAISIIAGSKYLTLYWRTAWRCSPHISASEWGGAG